MNKIECGQLIRLPPRMLKLSDAYASMSVEELRYEWTHGIRRSSARDVLLAELRRRGVSYADWIALGRGRKRTIASQTH